MATLQKVAKVLDYVWAFSRLTLQDFNIMPRYKKLQ